MPSDWGLNGPLARQSALHGLIGYSAGWALAFVTALAIALVADDSLSFGSVVALPGQVVGLALFGSLHASTSSTNGAGSTGGSVTVQLVTWFVTAAILAAIGIAAARTDNRTTAARERLTAAAITGLTLALTSTVVAAVLPLRFGEADGGGDVSFGAAGPTLFLGATLLGAAAAFAGGPATRAWILTSWRRVPATIRPGVRAGWTHLWMTGVFVAALVLLLVPSRAGWRFLAAFPLWWGTATLDGLSMVHLGGLTLGGSGMGLSASTTITLFTEPIPKSYLVVVVGVIAIALLASVRLALLRPVRATTDWTTVWTTPTALGAAGLVIALLGTVHADLALNLGGSTSFDTGSSGSLNGLGGGTSFGPALTLVLVLAAWGVAIEVSSRLIAPALLTALPSRLVAFLATRSPDPQWAAVLPGLPTPTPPAADVDEPATGSADLGAPATLGTAPTVVALPKQVDSRRLRLIVGAAGGVIALAVLASVVVAQVNSRMYGPGDQVAKYVDALVAGDASKAVALADPGLPDAKRVLLTDTAFKSATNRITDYEIGKVDKTSDRATVAVTLHQGGQRIPTSFRLVRDGHTAVLFDRWRLVAPDLGRISAQVPSDGAGVAISGVKVPAANGYVNLPAFPGTYQLGLTEVSKYFTSTPTPATVSGWDAANVELAYSPTAALNADITKALDAELDACIAATVADPPDCPNNTYSWQALSDVTWTLDERPTYDIRVDSGESIFVDTTTSGTATIHATREEKDWSTGAVKLVPYEETTTIRTYTRLRVNGDTVEIIDS